MADAINARNAAPPTGYVELWMGGFQADANGPTLTLPGGYWTLAGTETGLGIPKPPLSLSCSYDKTLDKIHLKWINPAEAYDSIRLHCFCLRKKARRLSHSETLPGAATEITINRGIMNVDEFDAHIIAYKNGIPSNSVAVRLTDGGYCQSEVYGVPFIGDVAPNWSAWSTTPKPDATKFKEGTKFAGDPLTMYSLLAKTLHQVIKAPGNGTVHGVCRKFLGLTPGHTYRLTAALNTLEMDSVNGDWELAVCAAANGSDGKDLTPQQMAGLVALPDSSKGLEASRRFSYGPRNTSRGIWELSLTGHKKFLRPASSHITMPAGADTLTVWVRFKCSDSNGKIAFSGVKLEDVTALGQKLKTAEEVIKQERRGQANLRGGEAWLKEKAAIEKNKNK
jgi:hypothetical protein